MVRSQSAMEYLMTYGWAILIIAVILGALYQVGVFNPYTFSPKVAAGACKVARGIVDGQVTSSKVGTCNNALPQYVASFNGASSYVALALSPQITGMSYATICAWVYLQSASSSYPVIAAEPNTASWNFNVNPSDLLYFQVKASGGFDTVTGSAALAVKQWQFVCSSYDGSALKAYIGGKQDNSQSATYTGAMVAPTAAPSIGGGWGTYWFGGQIANVQIYNSSLSSNEISSLYKEGIGGTPISTANLVGWWPLNGDGNDYSGNGNNGTPTNVVFTGSWVSGYSAS